MKLYLIYYIGIIFLNLILNSRYCWGKNQSSPIFIFEIFSLQACTFLRDQFNCQCRCPFPPCLVHSCFCRSVRDTPGRSPGRWSARSPASRTPGAIIISDSGGGGDKNTFFSLLRVASNQSRSVQTDSLTDIVHQQGPKFMNTLFHS